MTQETLLAEPDSVDVGEGQAFVMMVGHSKHTWPKFATLLTYNDVRFLVDVRSSPSSRFCPQFNQKALSHGLAGLGIGYHHAPALGGKDPRPLAEQSNYIAYECPTPRGVCVMCSEADFRTCHRHYILAPLFIALGWTVEQILPDTTRVRDLGPTPATLRKMARFLP